jgi:hypothetical protein
MDPQYEERCKAIDNPVFRFVGHRNSSNIKSGGGADYHGQCSRGTRRSFCRPAGLPKSLKSALGCPGPGNHLSKDMKGFAAFWPEAKYGKMRIEGRDPVNA